MSEKKDFACTHMIEVTIESRIYATSEKKAMELAEKIIETVLNRFKEITIQRINMLNSGEPLSEYMLIIKAIVD